MSTREKLFWAVVLSGLASFIMVRSHAADMPPLPPGAKPPRKAVVPLTQGAGAAALLAPTPKAVVLPPAPVYYFAATATDDWDQESAKGTQIAFTNAVKAKWATLAWNAPACTNVITNYSVFKGRVSGTYTNTYPAGTNLTLTVPLAPPALTNLVLTVTTTGATNLAWATSLKGPWTRMGVTNWTATNVTGTRYYRAMKPNSKVFISKRLQ